jgi:catechol 2,3-dioxygenase-like lactoylglutathione lyase family enzyme
MSFRSLCTAVLRRGLLAAFLCLALGTAAIADAPRPAAPLIASIDSIAIPVSDMDRAVTFYTQVLTFRVIADREVAGDTYEHLFSVFGLRLRLVRLELGEEHLELMQFLAPRGRTLAEPMRSNDLTFQHVAIIVSDMQAAYARLRSFNVEHASSGPQVLPRSNPNAGGIAAFYFRDPDGNHLEILQFPPDKGAARWQSHAALFLGIDHTAIVVGDTDASLHYYRDLLGLRVAGNSENSGTEQEHLNNVFGARLRITALRAAAGPGIELLEYLAPHTGRPAPRDTQANDRWYWQIQATTRDVAATEHLLLAARASLVSSATVALDSSALGYRHAVIARDPDGHAMAFISGEQR